MGHVKELTKKNSGYYTSLFANEKPESIKIWDNSL